MTNIINDILAELNRQLVKWGDQSARPDYSEGKTGTVNPAASIVYYTAAEATTKAFNDDPGTKVGWDTVLLEEVFEAIAEPDLAKKRAELVQVAAVAANWIASIDKRLNGPNNSK